VSVFVFCALLPVVGSREENISRSAMKLCDLTQHTFFYSEGCGDGIKRGAIQARSNVTFFGLHTHHSIFSSSHRADPRKRASFAERLAGVTPVANKRSTRNVKNTSRAV